MKMDLCSRCPRSCGIDRAQHSGYCGESAVIRIARAAPHFWEEPPISGTNGSGTIFFSGCNLRCIYCQNAEIALGKKGRAVTPEELSEIMLKMQMKGLHNINLVTPTHYAAELIPVLKQAKSAGLKIPVVWNSSAYESVETLCMLEGIVDIYLPDFKYIRPDTAEAYSRAADYPEIAQQALNEMVRQNPEIKYDKETGLMRRGVQIRHMVLPGHAQESREILWYLFRRYGNSVGYSIMNQYTPMPAMKNHKLLSRRVTDHEYLTVIRYAEQIGIRNAFIQEGETASESFIPGFNGEILI